MISNNLTCIFYSQDNRDLLKEKDPDIKDHELLMRDPRAFLANLPPLPTLEAFQRHRDMLSSPQSFLSAAAASLRNPGGLMPPTSLSQHMSPFGMSPLPQRPPSQPTTPSSQSSSPVQQSFGSNAQNWSFEEQFKQVRLSCYNSYRCYFITWLLVTRYAHAFFIHWSGRIICMSFSFNYCCHLVFILL